MIQELLYTSAPKGLKPGSRGFCTVLSTSGMPAPIATALESLSGYRPVFPPGDPQAKLNPVVYSHLKMSLGGRRCDVLSRVADYGLDYSQRTNKIAHHLVVDSNDRPSVGPAWLLSHPDVMRTSWEGEPHIVSGERSLPKGNSQLKICAGWGELTGDAGWAGVLAESFLNRPEQPVYIIFSPGMDVLSLIEEALVLLPANQRWDVTFSTYFTKIPNGVTCNWRCVLADSPEAKESRRYVQSLRIDLTEPLGRATGGTLVEAARTGRAPVEAVQEPVVATTPEVKSTHQDAPPAAGNVPPIRVSDGRSVPILRKRVSEYPVGHAEQAHGGTSSSWFKWVIALTLLALISGGGAVAMRTGWRPLSCENPPSLAANTNSSTKAEKEAPQSSGAKSMASSNQSSGNESQAGPSMLVESTQSGDQKSDPAEKSDEAAEQVDMKQKSADEKNSVVSPMEMAANGNARAVMPSPENNGPGRQDHNQKAPPRETELHWMSQPEKIKASEPYLIQLPREMKSASAEVLAWCPIDNGKRFRSKNNSVQRYDTVEGKFVNSILASVKSKPDKQESFLQVEFSSTLMPMDFNRIVFEVSQKPDDIPLFVLLHNALEPPEKALNSKTYTNKFHLPIAHSIMTWKLRLDSIVYSGNRVNVAKDKTPPEVRFNDENLSVSLYVDYFEIVDRDSLEVALPAVLKNLAKLPVKLEVKVQKAAQASASSTDSEVHVVVYHEELSKTLRQHIKDKIQPATNLVGIPSIDVSWISESHLVTDVKFSKHLQEKMKEVQEYKVNGQGPSGGGNKEDEARRKYADDQILRIKELLEFATAAQCLTDNLKLCEVRELLISQECKNGDDTKYIPIIVYRGEVSGTNQETEE
ncbi:hypothetical protein [Planctomicrobium sp. SH527]|uniref:GAP1-N2 domain-containing protein n=1 Tax=Planctomicrobium sp. SH527 TaxID=3448123 RepID=UPI003F5C67D9